MARNSEKQYGRLNRLILFKEKEEYEKIHPKRPRLDVLDTAEEIQQWLPSIKRDIDFYLKKSQVVCYSDEHIEECKLKVIALEKEFKAFVRKIKQITPGSISAIPWTNRAYKRKNCEQQDPPSTNEFIPLATPFLNETPTKEICLPDYGLLLMDAPLDFSSRKVDDISLTCPRIPSPNNNCSVDNKLSHNSGDSLSTENGDIEKREGRKLEISIPSTKKLKLVNYNYSSDSDN